MKLVLLYLVTPVAKEAWIPLAQMQLGLPAPFAAALLLCVDAAMCLFVIFAVPLEKFTRLVPKVERMGEKVRDSRLARRGLAVALAGVIMLPFHSGGAILGSFAGRLLGLPPGATFAAVVGGVAVRFAVVLAAYEGWRLLA